MIGSTWYNYTKVGLSWSQKISIFQIRDFRLGISKNASNIIWRSIKNTRFSKISWVWVKNWACHAPLKFEIEMGMAGSIIELCNLLTFQNCIFFEDKQLTLVSFFEIHNGIWEKKNWPQVSYVESSLGDVTG